MLIDAQSLQSGEITKDVCIIGAGPAGITLAREFINEHLDVAIIESGGFEFDSKAQSLADGPTYGDIKPSIDVNRRQFGGNSNVWHIGLGPGEIGVRHALFDETDFLRRDWVPNSGWPFCRDHLIPCYKRAQVVCNAGPFSYSADDWENKLIQRWSLSNTELDTGIFQFSASNVFHKIYKDELIAAKNVTLYIHASANKLITDSSGETVDKVKLAHSGEKNIYLFAKVFILATGGFENAPLLLMSNQHEVAGLGNQHDVVGRYYHDHLQGQSGYLTPGDSQLLNRAALYDLRQIDGASVMGYLKLSKAVMEKEKLLNINCFLYPRPNHRHSLAIDSFNALRQENLFSKSHSKVVSVFPKSTKARHLLNAVIGSNYVVKMAYLARTKQQATSYGLGNGGWSQLRNLHQKFTRFEVWHSIEQSPHPHNRVKLDRERDIYGAPKLEVYWHWSLGDINQTLRAQHVIARELAHAGLGKLHLEHDPNGLPNIVRPARSHHLMGTTRMHADPKFGVVDAECRVHGMNNLFVAGSSTFPAGGYANPTLTIVAMALRLEDLIQHALNAQTAASGLFDLKIDPVRAEQIEVFSECAPGSAAD